MYFYMCAGAEPYVWPDVVCDVNERRDGLLFCWKYPRSCERMSDCMSMSAWVGVLAIQYVAVLYAYDDYSCM